MNHTAILLTAWLTGAAIPAVAAAAGSTSGDAYIRSGTNRWILGTAKVEKIITLEAGRLQARSFRQPGGGGELLPPGAAADEFFASVEGQPISGVLGPWRLAQARTSKLAQGELQLDLTVERQGLRVTKSYLVHPGSSIIREWVCFANAGTAPLALDNPGFLSFSARPGAAPEFYWMTGGDNKPGSWMLKTERLDPFQPRRFDSYDPFPGRAAQFPGDGVEAAIFLNDRQVWPAGEWQVSANALARAPFDFTAAVAEGDRLVFRTRPRANHGWDTTAFAPVITYEDGETHAAAEEFSAAQGRAGWRYQYLEGGQCKELVYYADRQQWRLPQDNRLGIPFVGRQDQHPAMGQEAARVWTAPKTGRVRIAGGVCNTGNREEGMGPGGVRMGSCTYAPWAALLDRQTGTGLFLGWDYFGHWSAVYSAEANGHVSVKLGLAGYHKALRPGESVTTPRALVGLFRDDLDNAGNECLDWQYRYLWDYTRPGWFPAIRALHWWSKGTGWGLPGTPWTGGNADPLSTYRKILRTADFMRYTGVDVYHRDWGWWDCAGDWNGPDFRGMNAYLRKHQMGLLIYAFLYTVDPKSKVAREHPDWVLGGSTLDLSRPEVAAFIQQQLEEFAAKYGDFEWRNDSDPLCPRLGDDTPLLAQDQHLRQIIRTFLDRHPGCAFQAVNGGGICTGYDYARYASTVQFSDGAVGMIRNYWAALLLPPDKSNDQPDISNPDQFAKATWRGTLCCNFDTTGDTWQADKLEGLRELNDIYHYLHAQGVVGRWVRVHRPAVSGDDPTLYFQRLSRDARRSLLIPKRPAPGPVTIFPKGLLPAHTYLVTFQESAAWQLRTGADLMASGIALNQMAPGELIYLNLPYHPGNHWDRTAPQPARQAAKRRADNLGYPGVELSWQPGRDDQWLSYYEILRDGAVVDKAAKGTFYFDHSAGADLAARYEVRAVDGAGNRSALAAARGPAAQPSHIVDDGNQGEVHFSPGWQVHHPPALVAHQGTLTVTRQSGATAEITFTGRRVIWFTKLNEDGGRAAVSVDGGAPEVVDTYAADEIWGVGVYRKEFPASGRHTLRITVLGEHSARAKGDTVAVDGFRVEKE